jgi:hypothetical protein
MPGIGSNGDSIATSYTRAVKTFSRKFGTGMHNPQN